MEGEDTEALPARSVLQCQLFTDSGLLGDRQKVAQGIDHHVADHENAAAGPTFFEEVLDGVFCRNQEIVGKCVGQDAVDLFGHRTVKAAESGLDVSYADTELRRGERNGDSGIDIAYHENQVRLAFDQNRLNTLQNFGGLRGVRARANFEIDVRGGDAHLAKENVGQLLVIVLAGVNEDGLDFRVALHLMHERRNFRKVGARPYDIHDFQALAHGASVSNVRRQYSIREIAIQGGRIAIRAKKALLRCIRVGIRRETWVK